MQDSAGRPYGFDAVTALAWEIDSPSPALAAAIHP
jgi:hypothetical protein